MCNKNWGVCRCNSIPYFQSNWFYSGYSSAGSLFCRKLLWRKSTVYDTVEIILIQPCNLFLFWSNGFCHRRYCFLCIRSRLSSLVFPLHLASSAFRIHQISKHGRFPECSFTIFHYNTVSLILPAGILKFYLFFLEKGCVYFLVLSILKRNFLAPLPSLFCVSKSFKFYISWELHFIATCLWGQGLFCGVQQQDKGSSVQTCGRTSLLCG